MVRQSVENLRHRKSGLITKQHSKQRSMFFSETSLESDDTISSPNTVPYLQIIENSTLREDD